MFSLFALQVRGRMLSTTTAIIHWDEPEEPNGQVVGYRVYYTSDNTLLVNQVPVYKSLLTSCVVCTCLIHKCASVCLLALMLCVLCCAVGEADGAQRQLHHHPELDS